MKCNHCGAAGAAIQWDYDGDAWRCMICGGRDYLPVATTGEYPDSNMQFSVNCGSIVSERTHGRMRVRRWVEVSKTTSLWHAHQEKVGKEIVYFTDANSFDYGQKKYEELKRRHYIANDWQQNLRAGEGYYRDRIDYGQPVAEVMSVSSDSGMIATECAVPAQTDPSSSSVR